jgi:hypothetical protein
VRFEVTTVLDEIEQRLTTDVILAQAVLDVAEPARLVELDGGRSVNLLRLGLVIDALGRHLAQGAVMIYPVVSRSLITDQDLTSKERMVLGRWADDGLIEVVGTMADRVAEVADMTGLPVVTRDGMPRAVERYPWLQHQPDRVLRLVAREGIARLLGPRPQRAGPSGAGAALTASIWRCSRAECPAFGSRRAYSQPVPRMRAGVPVCPRHDEPLTRTGPRPPAVGVAVLVGGSIVDRFVVRAGRSTLVGRAPEDGTGVPIGQWLEGDTTFAVSRTHVQLDLTPDGLQVEDLSTNGTSVIARSTPTMPPEVVALIPGRPYRLGRWDSVELVEGVELVRTDALSAHSVAMPGSVMGDAPTIALKAPPRA